MTLTVAERIKVNVVAALAAIRVVHNCRFDAIVEDVTATTNIAKGDVYFAVGQEEPTMVDDQPIGLDDYAVVHNVAYRRVTSENDTDRSVDALHAEVFGEVKAAIMADEKLGGLAIRVYDWNFVKGRTEGSGAVEGEVNFTAHYRTLQDDMFSSAFEPQP